MNERSNEKSRGDLTRDSTGLANYQTSRDPRESSEGNRVFEKNGWIHYIYDPKKMVLALAILGFVGYVFLKFVDILQGYNTIQSNFDQGVHNAVPKTPYETPDGRSVTLFRQIDNMYNNEIKLQDEIEVVKKAIENKKAFEQAPYKNVKSK